MIRYYHDILSQGIVLNNSTDGGLVLVRDGLACKPLFKYHLDRLHIYCSLREITIEEMLSDGLAECTHPKHPWERFGAYPLSAQAKLERYSDPFHHNRWWESQFDQAYRSYKALQQEVEKYGTTECGVCVDGPKQGDMINSFADDWRVELEGFIYQKQSSDHSKLTYVRTLNPDAIYVEAGSV